MIIKAKGFALNRLISGMRTIIPFSLTLLLLFATSLRGDTYYVAPSGNDSTSGSFDQPFKTLAPAINASTPGDTIYMRGGLYAYSSLVSIEISGGPGNLIRIWAYPGETPVLDFQLAGSGTSARGISVRGDYWHLRELVVQHAGDNGVYVDGAHNILERLMARENGDSGIQLHTGAAHNQVLNCDSYLNYDPDNHGENADGFAAKFSLGEGNLFRGCRAWNNSDDGWDFWEAGNGVTVENCWSFRNGEDLWGEGIAFAGDGNGFKLGMGTGAHSLVRCVAFDLPHHGIDVNGNTTGVQVFNSTCYRNAGRNFYFDEHSSSHVLRNNLSAEGGVNIYTEIDDEYNSWNGFSVTAGDFSSLDTTGVTGPRSADGGLPQLGFLHLAEGSSLINAGIDVGLAFAGTAPDLGAFEFGTGTAVAAEPGQLPIRFALRQNYPNPFNPATTITYEAALATRISLTIYDLLGREIATLVNDDTQPGIYQITWDAGGLPSGFYVARLKAPGTSKSIKMLLLR